MTQTPLAVDLDGTLIYTDLIQESLIRFILERPWRILQVLIWWLHGRAYLKREVSKRINIDVSVLPYNQELLTWLQEQKNSGRKLYLVSGSEQSLVTAVADHCGIFEEAKGSDGIVNCTGNNKANWLEAKFGKRGFDYAGNSSVDIKVWKRANQSVIVSSSSNFAANLNNISKRFIIKNSSVRGAYKAIRIHQWAKALLVFMPLFAAHEMLNFNAFLCCLKSFTC